MGIDRKFSGPVEFRPDWRGSEPVQTFGLLT
jgi:hypothetical protein